MNTPREERLLSEIIALFDAFTDEPCEDPSGPPGNRNNELRRTYKFGLEVGGAIAAYQKEQEAAHHD